MAVVLLAGVSKLIALDEFTQSLRSWTIVPPALRYVLALAAPLAEVLLGACWIFDIGGRRRMEIGAALLLLAYTVALLAQWAVAAPPNCDCLGLVMAHFRWLRDVRAALARNCLLIGLLLPSLARGLAFRHGLSPTRPARPARRADASAASAPRRAFTMVELLIVVLIVAVSVALLLPALRATREQARTTVSLSNIRQHALVFSQYNADWRGAYPEFCDPRSYEFDVPLPSLGTSLTLRYFEQYIWWNLVLADDYYGADPFHAVFHDPSNQEPGYFTDYLYGCCFLADPAYWRETTRLDPTSQWRATFQHEVVWPSRKVLLTRSSYEPGQSVLYGLVDASAGSKLQGDASGFGYPYGDGINPGSYHSGDVHYYLHTRDGVRAFDFVHR